MDRNLSMIVVLAALAGCGGGSVTPMDPDAGTVIPGDDGGSTPTDGGDPTPDGGWMAELDGGWMVELDGGPPARPTR